MEVTIANKTIILVNQTGTKDERNLTYGKVYYDKVFSYIDVVPLVGTPIQLRAEHITKYNGVSGQPTYASIMTDLEANTRA